MRWCRKRRASASNKPAALGAEHEQERLIGDRDVEHGLVAVGVEADAPHLRPPRLLQRVGDPGDERDRKMLDRTGCRLRDRGCDADGPVAQGAPLALRPTPRPTGALPPGSADR